MSVFDVDFDVLTKQLLPVRLRRSAGAHGDSMMVAWMKCLVSPVKYVQVLFNANRANDLYVLAHDGQVCYLDAALNDLFDNTLRRIYISDPAYIDPDYLYRRNEGKPLYLYQRSEHKPVYLYQRSETYEGAGVTFIVNVPIALGLTAGQVLQLRALVNKYRLPGMMYSVVFF